MKLIDILYQDQKLGTIEWDNETKHCRIYTWQNFNDPVIEQLYLATINRFNHWSVTGKLPYPMPREEMFPWEDDWWEHIRKHMIHAIQFGPVYELKDKLSE